jgi:hypothetical protein
MARHARLPGSRRGVAHSNVAYALSIGPITCAYHVEVQVGARVDPVPGVVGGPAEVVAERLAGFARLGFTALSITPVGPDPAGQVERLAQEVIPLVRAGVA